MIRWEKEDGIFRGYLKDYYIFAIWKEGYSGEDTCILTSPIFYDENYSSLRTAKRGAERKLSRFLEHAGLEIDCSWLT